MFYTNSSSTSPPQDPSNSLEPTNTRSNEEATEDCSKGVAGNCNREGVPEWPEDFTENLEIAEVLAPADISHDSDLERPMKVASRKHSIFTHFPKDQNREVCRSEPRKITRVSCRRRAGNSVFRTEKFGDLTTADHNVLNEGSASRHNHRYSIVVQDLASQWIQSYPCKTKPSKETEKEFTKISRAVSKSERNLY